MIADRPAGDHFRAHRGAIGLKRAQFDGAIGQQDAVAGFDVARRSSRRWWRRVGNRQYLLGRDGELRARFQRAAAARETAQPDLGALQIEQDGGGAADIADAWRMAAIRAACSACVPCEAFRRNTSTPADEQLPDAFGASLAGPSVATILVLAIKSGTIPFCPNMPIYQVIVLAIVQGLTEFLPDQQHRAPLSHIVAAGLADRRA